MTAKRNDSIFASAEDIAEHIIVLHAYVGLYANYLIRVHAGAKLRKTELTPIEFGEWAEEKMEQERIQRG